MESLNSLLTKLNNQISDATKSNRTISQLESDLIKETLRKMYDLIGTDSMMNIPTSDKTQIIQEPQVVIQEKEQIIGFATMVQETMKQKLKEEHPIVPLPIVQEAPSAPVIEARPAVETAAVINSAPQVVSEIPIEIEVVIPAPTPATPPPIAPRPAIEEKVIAARTQQIKAASLFEEQSTVASKYSAQETIGQKINRDQPLKTLSDTLQHTHLADLKLSIGINERFAFINELFAGDQQLYHQSIEHLNSMQVYEEARKLLHEELKQQLGWQTGSERFRQFDELVKRRFHA
jgi:hypothetical protein